jgi:ABC-type glycerol-3-phosphate transport system substrate-binding protein
VHDKNDRYQEGGIMHNRKHVYRHALVLFVLVFLLCNAFAYAQEKITLRVITGYAPNSATWDLWQEFIQEYEELNPHIVIENRGSVAQADVLLMQLISNEPPDIIKTDMPTVLSLHRRDLIQPMPKQYVDRFTAAYFPSAIQALQYDDTLLGIPASSNVTGIIYNTRIFAEKGVAGPPRTWEELHLLGPKLSEYSGTNIIQPAITVADNWNLDYFLTASILAEGGQIIDQNGNLVVDQEPTYRAFQRWLDAVNHGYFAFNKGGLFSSGQLPMVFGWPFWQVTLSSRHNLDDFRSAPTLAGTAGTVTTYRNHAYCVPTVAHQQEEAWKFLEWMTSKESGYGGTRLGYFDSIAGTLPITRSDITAPYNRSRQQFMAGFLEAIEYSVPSVPWMRHGLGSMPELSNALKKTVAGVSPQQSINEAVTLLKSKMEDWRK